MLWLEDADDHHPKEYAAPVAPFGLMVALITAEFVVMAEAEPLFAITGCAARAGVIQRPNDTASKAIQFKCFMVVELFILNSFLFKGLFAPLLYIHSNENAMTGSHGV